MRMCINPKVIAGLAVLGAGVYLVAPSLIAGLLPLLVVAICPLSMLAMMWGMQRMGGMQGSAYSTRTSQTSLTREERLDQLRSELRGVQSQQAALREEIEALAQVEPELPGRGKALAETE